MTNQPGGRRAIVPADTAVPTPQRPAVVGTAPGVPGDWSPPAAVPCRLTWRRPETRRWASRRGDSPLIYFRRQGQVTERYFGSVKQSRLMNGSRYPSRQKVLLYCTLATVGYLATMLAHVQAGDSTAIRQMRIRVIR